MRCHVMFQTALLCDARQYAVCLLRPSVQHSREEDLPLAKVHTSPNCVPRSKLWPILLAMAPCMVLGAIITVVTVAANLPPAADMSAQLACIGSAAAGAPCEFVPAGWWAAASADWCMAAHATWLSDVHAQCVRDALTHGQTAAFMHRCVLSGGACHWLGLLITLPRLPSLPTPVGE